MREIKFRCWNAPSRTMQDWDSLIEHGSLYRLLAQPSSYPVMQFTGLKDKNDVDIYEGDILESVSEMINVSNHPVKTGEIKRTLKVVSYDESKGAFVTSNSIVSTMSQNIISKYSTAIGNVHQNPELLESK